MLYIFYHSYDVITKKDLVNTLRMNNGLERQEATRTDNLVICSMRLYLLNSWDQCHIQQQRVPPRGAEKNKITKDVKVLSSLIQNKYDVRVSIFNDGVLSTGRIVIKEIPSWSKWSFNGFGSLSRTDWSNKDLLHSWCQCHIQQQCVPPRGAKNKITKDVNTFFLASVK